MKVLILSCGTGGGHNSAALAVQENLKEKNVVFMSKDFDDIMNLLKNITGGTH